MRLSVIVPMYNERSTIRQCLRRVLDAPFDKEIIVVDDASTDGSAGLVETVASEHAGSIRLITHAHNQGKGAALRTGIMHATGDVVVVQDADLEYDPRDYPALVGPIARGHADVVMGSRFLGGEHRVLYFWHSVGNQLLTLLSNALTNLNLTDMETCYKAFRRGALQNFVIESNRFGFEPEITAKVAKSPCVVYEVPISYHGRTYAQGKKITWRDGCAAIVHIVRYNLLRRPEQCWKRSWAEVHGLVAGTMAGTAPGEPDTVRRSAVDEFVK
jgi:glycosyltransferase involved in cell wall biosynthesis